MDRRPDYYRLVLGGIALLGLPLFTGAAATAAAAAESLGSNRFRVGQTAGTGVSPLWTRRTASTCEFQTGAGMNSPPIAFEYEGVQYLAAYSAGNLFAGSPRGDSLWLFSSRGTMEPAPPASAALRAAGR